MTLSITTTATTGQLIVYIINSNNQKILTVNQNDSESCQLEPGETYDFEWHVWGAEDSDYTITAKVDPNNAGFPPLNFAKSYEGPHKDSGVFSFTV